MDSSPKTLLLLFCGLPGSGKSTVAGLSTASDSPLLRCFATVTVVHIDDIYNTEIPQHGSDANIGSSVDDAQSWSPASWRRARTAALERVQALLRDPMDSRGPRLILVDDNFYYRSMRRPYYNAARKYGAAYAVLQFVVDVDEAIRRDALRTGIARVGQHVILRMANMMEPPTLRRLVVCTVPSLRINYIKV